MVNRRHLLAALGVGAVPIIGLGASERLGDGQDSQDLANNPDSQTEEEPRVVDDMVFEVINLVDITPDKLTLGVNLLNKHSKSFKIKAYSNTITPETPATWEFNTVIPPEGTVGVGFDEERTEWFSDPDPSYVRPELVLDNKENHISTVEITPGVDFPRQFEELRYQNIPYYEVEFELSEEPPMYQSFLYTFALDLSNFEDAQFDGEVVGRTPHIMRVGEDDFIYPRWHDGEYPAEDPAWGGDSFTANNSSEYSGSDVYHSEIGTDFETRVKTAQITRVSNYGLYSDKYSEIADKASQLGRHFSDGASLISSGYPHYLRSPIQNPWSIYYEVDLDTLPDIREQKEEILRDSKNDSHEVWDMIHTESAMNHEKVQEVASKLGGVCEQINATSPTEQIRVVADFVQYLGYSMGGASEGPGSPNNDVTMMPGTNHPVLTLALGVGDCKDFTILGEALLQQDPFNFDVSEAVFNDITWFNWNNQSTVGHVSIGVAFDDLEIEKVTSDTRTRRVGTLGAKPCTFTDEGKEYMYLETTTPHPMGYIGDHPEFEVPPKSLRDDI